MTRALRWMSPPVILLLAACGGGSGSKPRPSIQITSPVDGQAFTSGNRSVTVSGTGAHMDTVEVRLNGAAIAAADVSSTDSGFTATVTLGDNANTIEAIAGNSQGSASSGVITVTYPFASFATFQPAAVVVGQADFTHGGANEGGISAATLAGPYGNPLVNAGKLYVGDYRNNRVLVFDSIPTTNGASANLVLGQPDFTTATAGTTASQWGGSQTVADGSGRLLVAEYTNSRVLILNSIPTASSPAADLVVGQADLTSRVEACTQTGLYRPESIFVVGGKLLVADSNNHRVLVWNSIPTTSGAPADLVLGQADFTHCSANAGGMTATASSLDYPSDVWSDGNRLVVVDQNNNRVLIWSTFPTANDAPADIAVGQVDLTSSGFDATSGALDSPYFVASNGNQLFVADYDNNRVTIWNTFPTSSGALADVVIGQGAFGMSAYNDDNQDGIADSAPTARTLSYPTGIALRDDQLFVVDESNNRLLIYDAQ